MIEVERKFRIDSIRHGKVVAALAKSGYETKSQLQLDKVFLLHSDSFEEFTPGDPVVRLRTVDEVATLTLKKAVGDRGTSIEHETKVDSTEECENILRALGFNLVIRIKKDRKMYLSPEATIVVDEVAELGSFLEIEIICKSLEQVPDAEGKIELMASQLGLGVKDIEPKKYDVLLTEKQKRDNP